MTTIQQRSLQKSKAFYLTKKLARLKAILLIAMAGLAVTFLGDAYFSTFDLVDIATLTCIAFLAFLYYWLEADTADIVIGLCLWALVVLISFFSWSNYGLYDAGTIAFPCIIMLSIIFGAKPLFIPIFIYIQSFTLILMFFHLYGYIDYQAVTSNNITVRAFDILMINSIFAFATYFYISDLKLSRRQLFKRVARLKQQLQKTNELINYDKITHLPNERICQQDITPILQQIELVGRNLAFIRMDINNLRNINNSIGHEVGEQLLHAVAVRLLALIKEDEYLYLFQGNEFVFAKVSANNEQINTFKEQIVQAMSQPFVVHEYELEAFISIGIAVAPFDGLTISELQKKSHQALSHANNKGINTSLFYDESMSSNDDHKYQLIKDLKIAITEQEFEVYYQPKFDLKTNKVVGAEALVRWRSKIHGFIGPDVFIPVAEESGLIVEITKWVLHEACNTCKTWHDSGFDNLHVAINLSSIDFRRGNLPRIVANALHLSKLPAKFLELEITESMMVDDVSHIQNQINQLHQSGVRFAIDDFGTGYSNLAYLSKFNVSTLKIDQSFIRNIMTSEQDFLIVRAIIKMSKSLGVNNVAEGIEELGIVEKLAQEYCEYGQGYFWEKPLRASDFSAFLKAHKQQ